MTEISAVPAYNPSQSRRKNFGIPLNIMLRSAAFLEKMRPLLVSRLDPFLSVTPFSLTPFSDPLLLAAPLRPRADARGDAHLCCGSAGTYSILQPELSRQLRTDKLAALQTGAPHIIATANIGCQLHLQAGIAVPVRHWIELLDGD